MSEHRIRDNTGNAYGLKIDSANRAHTDATTAPEIKFQATKGQAFITATARLTFAAGVETPALWVKVTSETLLAHFSHIDATYNGGDTNHDRTMTVRMYSGSLEPSANHTLYEPVNMLIGNALSAPATDYVWDGVGAGMTVSNYGTLALTMIVAKGTTDINFNGALIAGKNSVIMFTIEVEEEGSATILSNGFFNTLED